MSRISELAQHPQLPGILREVLGEMDARIAQLEQHHPMLADLAQHYAEMLKQKAEAFDDPPPTDPGPPAQTEGVDDPPPTDPGPPAEQQNDGGAA